MKMSLPIHVGMYILFLCRSVRRIFLHHILQDEEEGNLDLGMDYMVQAAEAGDRSAMIYVAKAFETGVGLGKRRYMFIYNLFFALYFIIQGKKQLLLELMDSGVHD